MARQLARPGRGDGPKAPRARVSATVRRGLREAKGSWKTIWARRRKASRSCGGRPQHVLAVEAHLAARGGVRRRMARPSVLLPQPLSPTRPRVSPLLDGEADAIDRAGDRGGRAGDEIAPGRRRAILHLQAVDLEQRAHGAATASPSITSRQRMQAVAWVAVAATQAGAVPVPAARLGEVAARMEAAAGGQIGQGGQLALDGGQLRPPGRRGSGASASGPRYRDGAAGAAARPCAARSMMRPAYMTATRSQVAATTPRSWVMRMMARPVRSRSSSSSRRICACTVTSSAVVGSSAMRSCGSAGDGRRDHGALAHAAAELMGIGIDIARRIGDADLAQQVDRPAAAPRAWTMPFMIDQRLGDLPADGHQRIEMGGRVLEDHGDPARAEPRSAASGRAADRDPRTARGRRRCARGCSAAGAGSSGRSRSCPSRSRRRGPAPRPPSSSKET